MRKLFVTLVITGVLFLLGHDSFSQVGRFRGGKYYQVGLGFSDGGILGNIYYGINFDQLVSGMVGGGLIYGEFNGIRYNSTFLDALGSYNMSQLKNRFYLNVVGGISFVGDFKNDFPSETYDKDFSFNYGLVAGIESDFHLTRSIVFVLGGTQRYYLKSDFGNGRYHLYAALRYSF